MTPGFTVHDAGAEGFHIEITVFWSGERCPTAEGAQTSLVNLTGKAFEELQRRLGP